jgi:hypothetical protein
MSATMIETYPPASTSAAETRTGRVARLRALAWAGLRRMYRPQQHDFVFTLRRTAEGVRPEGESVRYTAITLLALAREASDDVRGVLGGESAERIGARLVERVADVSNLGDVALTCRAAAALAIPTLDAALERLQRLFDEAVQFQTVELAWVVAATCEAPQTPMVRKLRERAGRLLCGVFEPKSGLFPHTLDERGGTWLASPTWCTRLRRCRCCTQPAAATPRCIWPNVAASGFAS